MGCHRFYLLRATILARPNVVVGILDLKLRRRWCVFITEVTRISIRTTCAIIVEESEKLPFTIVQQLEDIHTDVGLKNDLA